MKITLIGYMASGKTLVGKALSQKYNLPFIDLDTRIEKASGRSISELMPIKNGLYFRQLEREELLTVLEQPNFVLSCGGGTPCYYNNMDEINSKSDSVYLHETPKKLAERLILEKTDRPLVKNIEDKDMLEFVAKHLFERRLFYERAKYVIRKPNKIEQITELLKK